MTLEDNTKTSIRVPIIRWITSPEFLGEIKKKEREKRKLAKRRVEISTDYRKNDSMPEVVKLGKPE